MLALALPSLRARAGSIWLWCWICAHGRWSDGRWPIIGEPSWSIMRPLRLDTRPATLVTPARIPRCVRIVGVHAVGHGGGAMGDEARQDAGVPLLDGRGDHGTAAHHWAFAERAGGAPRRVLPRCRHDPVIIAAIRNGRAGGSLAWVALASCLRDDGIARALGLSCPGLSGHAFLCPRSAHALRRIREEPVAVPVLHRLVALGINAGSQSLHRAPPRPRLTT
jgi:hypothetical protein